MSRAQNRIAAVHDAVRYKRGVSKITIHITGGDTLTLEAKECCMSATEFASQIETMIDSILTQPNPQETEQQQSPFVGD